MKKVFSIIILIALWTTGYNQVIKGRILDKETQKPIDFAVAYFAGSFVGTQSDANGNFELDISKYPSMPLTINALGYYTVTITEFSSNKPLLVYLAPKIYALNEVVVGSGNVRKNIRERERYLKIFRKQFLGETPTARFCKIINENDINFTYEYDTLKAYASKPLLIDNLALGYRITFFLDQFEYIENEALMNLQGDILFNEDFASKDSRQKGFIRNRSKAYEGSRMQFFRALWDDKLDSVGFSIRDSLNNKVSYNELIIPVDSSIQDRKCLRYYERLYVRYKTEEGVNVPVNILLARPDLAVTYERKSRMSMLKDSVYFDMNGASTKGIRWYGRMALQRIADTLPFEYSPDEDLDKESVQQQNSTSGKDSLIKTEVTPIGHRMLNNSPPGEKIYLHLDRPNYMQGDTIWFKAYSWFGFDQLPDTVSKVLYVELLNPKDSVEIRKKLLIENGTSVGEFNIDKNITQGRYTIRAYTRWMQNENAGEPFYQTVTINALKENFNVDASPVIIREKEGDSLKVAFHFYEIDPKGDLVSNLSHRVKYSVRIGEKMFDAGQDISSNGTKQVFKCKLPEIGAGDSVAVLKVLIKDERLTFEKEFRIPLKEELDVQFFPEGGSLVNGLESRIAFKATGTEGLSREVKGVVKDSAGEIVTSFESSHKGMGSFLLAPQKYKNYTASVEYNHRLYDFPLPSASDEGLVMSVNFSEGNDTAKVRVKYSPSMENRQLYVTGSAYGKLRFISIIKTTPDSSMVSVPLELLPEGVSRLTLLGSDFKPLCERLIYADRGERFRVEVISDSISYGSRSKVTLKVKTTGISSATVAANLSLAVVDKEQVSGNNHDGGISAYKLLQSEVKGNIENPDDYFKGDSVNHRALDILLLTQGYRRFISDSLTSKVIKYYPERSFEINGKLALRGSSGKEKKFDYSTVGLTFLSASEKVYFDLFSPDSTGNFSFQAPLVYGPQLSLLKAALDKGRSFRGTIPKGKMFMGDIILDEAEKPKFKVPQLTTRGITAPAIEYIQRLQAVKKTESSIINDSIKWHLNLPEFTIKGKDKDWYTRFEDEAKKIVDMDSIDPTGRKFGNLYDLLEREFKAQRYSRNGLGTVFLPSMNTCRGKPLDFWLPIYVINGKTYCNGGEKRDVLVGLLNMLPAIRVSEIKKIMVLPPLNSINSHWADSRLYPCIRQSLVVIETYSKGFRGDPDGIKTFILEGLDSPRIFYSPRYEGTAKESKLYDGRATLYWNPSIKTDQNGEAKVEFYTGDRKAEMEIIINGIELGNGNTGEREIIIKANLNK